MGTLVPLRRIDGAIEEMSDEALLAACATHERAALGALFDRHHGAVHSFAARMLGGRADDADDVVQVTFETVSRSARKFKGDAAVRTWILGIARNVVRHHLRSRSRAERTALAAVDAPIAPPSSPLDDVRKKQELLHLARAVDALSPKQREVFVLVYLEGVAGKDVAAILGLREGTVYKRLHLARAKIRERLEGHR